MPRWYHYLVAMLIPPWSIIAGIIAFARNQVGPGIAFWAVGFIGFWLVWPILMVIIGSTL